MTDPTPLHATGTPAGTRPPVEVVRVPAWGDHALAIHAGAGPRPPLTAAEARIREDALATALDAGRAVLTAGGSAADAVCAAVVELEECAFFNAGRGAALTTDGRAELDACLVLGDGRAGAVAASTRARNPIRAARAVMERTRHVLVVDPPEERLRGWDCEIAGQDHFVVPARREALARYLAERTHGTVGAVARDRDGRVAAATSTGGITGQLPGRVGDTPVVGAGTYANAHTLAISGTGTGEYFVRGVLAHDVHARMHYAGAPLDEACVDALDTHLGDRGADGGVITVTPGGDVVLAWNSAAMYRGWLTAAGPVVHA